MNKCQADQALVNAQVSVNRAVFDMNRQHNGGDDNGPEYIVECIDAAEAELAEARRYYQQQSMKVKS